MIFRAKNSFYILLILITVLSACKSKKEIVETEVPRDIISADSVFTLLKSNELDYTWLRATFNAETNIDGRQLLFSGQIRMRSDSILWISLSKLGIEMMRLKITTDSVYLLNKMKNTYFSSDINYINAFLDTDLDFYMVQSLLLGNDFKYYSTEQFDARNNQNEYILHTVSRKKLKTYMDSSGSKDNLLIQKMHLDKNTLKIRQQNFKQVKNPNKKMLVKYSGFEDVNGQLFPTIQDYEIKGVQNITLSLKYDKLILNQKQRIPFKVTSKYSRVSK